MLAFRRSNLGNPTMNAAMAIMPTAPTAVSTTSRIAASYRNWRGFPQQALTLLVCGVLAIAIDTPSLGEESAQASTQAALRLDTVPGFTDRVVELAAGELIEVSVQVTHPSSLPTNGRLKVEWEKVGDANGRIAKLLHSLDADVYFLYRAPSAGAYRLKIAPDTAPTDLFEANRWREKGSAPRVVPIVAGEWSANERCAVSTSLRKLRLGDEAATRLFLEAEPNDTLETAQSIVLPTSTEDYHVQVTGTADDIEYFDNGHVGVTGDDWFKLEFPGPEPRLLNASLSIPDHQIAAQIRCYQAGKKPGEWIEYRDGANPNERAHQQTEAHRAAINRKLEPGKTYYLRVEANSPGYELDLRVALPAPYDDPRRAVRQALFDHIGQVDAWLTNRPRGASVERRIRDTGNLLGTGCMSCHTQSGVWGPAIPFTQGYRAGNLQSWRNLVNTCYQSLRPTNTLIDAANNTSLAPLDTGDGPAGTRVAGHAVAAVEQLGIPRRLQSRQLVRVANQILQTGDPGGVNAAGPGANHGTGVVLNYTGEVLAAAWRRTGNPHFFHAMVERAERLVKLEPKFTDDVAHRVEFFLRFFPADYPQCAAAVPHDAASLADPQWAVREKAGARGMTAASHQALAERIKAQVQIDVARLRAIQNEDGSWPFAPGMSPDGGKTWERTAKPQESDPAPTALALIALHAAGATAEDPAVARGVKALLRMQHPTGYWNAASQTGFVTTSYSMHALSRLFPMTDSMNRKPIDSKSNDSKSNDSKTTDSETADSETADSKTAASTAVSAAAVASNPVNQAGLAGESWIEAVRRVRDLANSGPYLQTRNGAGESPAESATRSASVVQLVEAAKHEFALVRYWACVGLGAAADERGVGPLVRLLGDPAKPVREAAHWGLRQTLINDAGWEETLKTFASGDERAREAAARALVMRVDAVTTKPTVDLQSLAIALGRGMNDDPHPAVRAWSARAAWNWWIWNPPTRVKLNEAWVKSLTRVETNAMVENGHRYQTQALFIANGHRANGSGEHQYAELAALFERLRELTTDAALDGATSERLNQRLIAVAATFFEQAGGDGGPGQLGYSTPGAGGLFGEAVLAYFRLADERLKAAPADSADRLEPLKLGLEAAANIPHRPLQAKLIEYSLQGPESLRALAAGSVSDPRSAQLVAVPEALEPLLDQILRGAAEPARRSQLSDPLFKLFARVRWVIPQTVEQQRESLGYLIPRFAPTLVFPHPNDPLATAAQPAREEAHWYLAGKFGDVLAENLDLHFDTTFEFFPQSLATAPQARFWLPSIPWILTYKTQLPDVQTKAGELPPVDPFAEPRSRALRLFLSQLSANSDPRNVELAVQLAGKTALRRNPEVLAALEQLVKVEQRKGVVEQAQRVLSTGRESFLKDLASAVKANTGFTFPSDDAGQPKLPQPFIDDVVYFRDYVLPEMSTVLRGDQRSCMACHGVPGRVPPLTLHRPDDAGYLPVAQMLDNYRLLRDRVDLGNVERSKLLRKPLNVQTGDEDGHQGGRRYQPNDPGYQILRKWALNQVELSKTK